MFLLLTLTRFSITQQAAGSAVCRTPRKLSPALTDAQTRVIPGNGPVHTRDDLQAQADMCGTMRTRFVEMMRKGMSAKTCSPPRRRRNSTPGGEIRSCLL